MPTTLARYARAAWMAIEPHPQPTSSSRLPGLSANPSFRQIRSCFDRWADSSEVPPASKRAQEYVIAGPRIEPVEGVAYVVVVPDGGGVTLFGMTPARKAHLFVGAFRRRANGAQAQWRR